MSGVQSPDLILSSLLRNFFQQPCHRRVPIGMPSVYPQSRRFPSQHRL